MFALQCVFLPSCAEKMRSTYGEDEAESQRPASEAQNPVYEWLLGLGWGSQFFLGRSFLGPLY